MSAYRPVFEPRVRKCGHVCVWPDGYVGADYRTSTMFDMGVPCCRCGALGKKFGLYIHTGCSAAERMGYSVKET